MLLKVGLLAYPRGIVSSRGIERACREHITFVALSGDTCPHFTTMVAFVSVLGELIGAVFKQVLLICDAQGLVGRKMFAIDGRQAAIERVEGAQRHAGRVRASSQEDGGSGVDDARAAPGRRCRRRRTFATGRGGAAHRAAAPRASGWPTTPRIARARARRYRSEPGAYRR